jgi:hypothetical protein
VSFLKRMPYFDFSKRYLSTSWWISSCMRPDMRVGVGSLSETSPMLNYATSRRSSLAWCSGLQSLRFSGDSLKHKSS